MSMVVNGYGVPYDAISDERFEFVVPSLLERMLEFLPDVFGVLDFGAAGYYFMKDVKERSDKRELNAD